MLSSFSVYASLPSYAQRLVTVKPKPSGVSFFATRRGLPTPPARGLTSTLEPGVGVRAQLGRARLRIAGDRPLLHELRGEVGRVVGVEELLGLLEARLTILVDVEVVVERAAERGRIAAFLLRHRADAAELLGELGRAQLVGHPAVRVLRHAPEPALDDGRGGARALLPRETGRTGA